MNTIKMFFGIALIITPSALCAQKVSVTQDKQRVKGTNMDGYSTELIGTQEEVSASYTKYLKGFSKIKTTGDQLQLTDVEINLTKYSSPFYAVTRSKGDQVTVWLGLNAAEWADAAQAEKAQKELEKIVYDFGVKYFRDKVQVDIDESVRAQQAAEKQTLRLQNENKNLTSRLEFNQKDKLRLEKALADNKLEYETLIANIAKNKNDQDSVSLATDQIKKMVEAHKEKQRKVN